jgi:hypothetical protein
VEVITWLVSRGSVVGCSDWEWEDTVLDMIRDHGLKAGDRKAVLTLDSWSDIAVVDW